MINAKCYDCLSFNSEFISVTETQEMDLVIHENEL